MEKEFAEAKRLQLEVEKVLKEKEAKMLQLEMEKALKAKALKARVKPPKKPAPKMAAPSSRPQRVTTKSAAPAKDAEPANNLLENVSQAFFVKLRGESARAVNGEDWSNLSLSNLKRKTEKDLAEYLESKVSLGRVVVFFLTYRFLSHGYILDCMSTGSVYYR